MGSPGEQGAGRERAGRRGKKEREVEVLKKGGKWEKLRNNTLQYFAVKRAKGGRPRKNQRAPGSQCGKCKMFRSFLSGYTRNILYCHLLYPFKIFFLSFLWQQTCTVLNLLLGNLRTTTNFTTTTSVDWEKTGTRTSVSAGKAIGRQVDDDDTECKHKCKTVMFVRNKVFWNGVF